MQLDDMFLENEETNEEQGPEMEEGGAEALAKGGLPKNFRQQADIEAFYRFVNENDLREEALTILDQVRQAKESAKTAKARVKH